MYATMTIVLLLVAGCSTTAPQDEPCGSIDYVPVCEVHIKSTRCECVPRGSVFGEYEDNGIYGEDDF